MKASSQSKKSTDTLKSERDGKSQIQGFFDNSKLNHETAFPLVPNPAPADTSNSNPPRGIRVMKISGSPEKGTFQLVFAKSKPTFSLHGPCYPSDIEMGDLKLTLN